MSTRPTTRGALRHAILHTFTPHPSTPHPITVRLRLSRWAAQPDRGDVPGWVLITIMTAGLVAALWLVAEPLLTGLFSDAVSSVGG